MKRPLVPALTLPTLTNLRRRAIPLAATAAALGLTGCGMLGGGHHDADSDTTSLTPQSTTAQVRAFTAGLDQALAQVEREKYQAQAGNPDGGADPAAGAVAPTDVDPSRAGIAPPSTPSLPSILFPPEYAAAADAPDVTGLAPMLTMDSFCEPGAAPRVKPAVAVAKASAAAAHSDEPELPLDAVLESLHDRIAAHPTLNTALALALLENAEGKTPDPKEMPVSQTLAPNDQKLLHDLVAALTAMNTTTAAPTLDARALPLIDASKKWRADADLTLPKLVLASRVDSYGVYTPIDPKFPAGKSLTVIIYCEVANFLPRKTDDGWYETRLSQQETLATDDGLLLWRPDSENVEDRSRNRRHDFYLVKKLTIPGNLAVGKYALRMSVTDRNTNKIAVVTLPIQIVP